MPRRPLSPKRLLSLVASCACLLLAPAIARAQSPLGPFEPWNSWWIHPVQSTLGIFYDGSAIRIDRDGNGDAESIFLRPTGQAGIPDAAIGSLRLTPTRTIVYAFGGSCNNAAGTQVHFYRVPLSGDRLDPIVTGVCIPHGILQLGFYDTGRCLFNGAGLDCAGRLGVSPQRIAWFATSADEFGFVNFVWVDLVTGTVAGPGFDFASNLGFVHVSPAGTQAFVQHDLGLPGETDYRLIDLCPGTLGTVINTGNFALGDVNAVLEAEVTAASGGTVTIDVTYAPGWSGPPIAPFELSDCLASTGACCFPSFCSDQYTQAQCQSSLGSYLGAGASCSACPDPPTTQACCFPQGNPACSVTTAAACTAQGGATQPGQAFCGASTCPIAEPALSISGPASAQVGDSVTYALDWSNDGGLTAYDAEIELQLPYGSTFVSATGGGDEAGGVVRWVLGDIAPGASGSVGVTFSLGCEVAQSTVYLQGLISQVFPPYDGRSYTPSEGVQIEVSPVASGALSVSVATTPARVPLRPGDEQTHVVTLANANGQAVRGVQLGSGSSSAPDGFSFGSAASFDRVVSAAGGTVDTSSGRFGWTGDVPAGQSAITFVTQIASCLPPGADETQLAFGDEIVAYDACGLELGRSGVPDAFALAQVAEVEIGATNLAPPQRLVAPIVDVGVQVTRPGGAANVSLSLGSGVGSALPGASLSIGLRGFNVTTPPSGPGVTWNPATREVAWSGTIPASGNVTLGFTGTVTACRGEINLSGSTSPGCTDIRANSIVAAVPEPPASPWLASYTPRSAPFQPGSFEDALVRIAPGAPTEVSTMLCVPTEYTTGVAGAPNGDVWVAPLPIYRLNPATLDFQAIDFARLAPLGMTSAPTDVAVDPIDGSVYFSGARIDTSGSAAQIVRYVPASDRFEPYWESSSYQSIEQLVVDEQGRIAALAYVGAQALLIRIDPGTPPVDTVLYDPPSTPVTDVAVDRDGSYLVLDGYYGTIALVDVDADTGAATPIVPNLRTAFPTTFVWGEIEVDAQGDVFVAPGQPGLGRITRATGEASTLLPITSLGTQAQTLLDLAMVGLPAPEPGAASLGGVALAALVALRRRGSVRR